MKKIDFFLLKVSFTKNLVKTNKYMSKLYKTNKANLQTKKKSL